MKKIIHNVFWGVRYCLLRVVCFVQEKFPPVVNVTIVVLFAPLFSVWMSSFFFNFYEPHPLASKIAFFPFFVLYLFFCVALIYQIKNIHIKSKAEVKVSEIKMGLEED